MNIIRNQMKLLAVLVSLALLAACGGTGSDNGGENGGPEPLTISISADNVTVAPGETVTLTATISGDGSDIDNVSWTATAGTFSADSGEETIWTAPGAGTFIITGELSAGTDSVTDTVTIEVTSPSEPLSITVAAAQEDAVYGQGVVLEALVRGDGASGVTVNWTAEADLGEFSTESGLMTTWTAPAAPGEVEITASVAGEGISDEVVIDVALCSAGSVGSSADPCVIANVHQLQAVAEHVDGHFQLAGDIDASDTHAWNGAQGFEPIGGSFSGTFNGDGFAINNLHIDRPDTSLAGLFSQIGESGQVFDVQIRDATVTGNFRTGIVAGRNYGEIREVSVSGQVDASANWAGGLVGSNSGGSVMWASSTADVTSEVNGAGGLVGENVAGAVISFASSTGNTVISNGNQNSGGLVGGNWNSEITDSYSTSVVEGNNVIGGLVGLNNTGLIERSYTAFDSAVTGDTWVGGLVGRNVAPNSGAPATIRHSYSIGSSVTGRSTVGGLVGDNADPDSVIQHSYAVIRVEATAASAEPAGLANGSDGTVIFSYWENVQFGPPTSPGGGEGRPITLMVTEANYPFWDFDTVWTIQEGTDTPDLQSNPR